MPLIALLDKDQKRAATFMQKRSLLYDDKKLCDIDLISGKDGQRFPCHRMALTAASNYFKDLFNRHSTCTEVVLNDVYAEQLEPLIGFCYTCKIDLNKDEDNSANVTTVKKLLSTALQLKMNPAIQACVDYLQMYLTPANCLGINALAKEKSLDVLKIETEKYAIENFDKVYQHEEFLQMPFEQFVLLIASDELHVPTEETVFNNIMCWVQHDALNRQQYIPELLKVMRLALLTPDFLNTEVRPVCMENNCEQLFTNALSWQSSPASSTKLSRQLTTPRWACNKAEVLLVFQTEDFELVLEVYCPIADKWRPSGRIEREISIYAAYAILNEALVIVGSGRNHDENTSSLDAVLSYDLKRKTLKELSSMQKPRLSFGVAVLDNKLYVIGGSNNFDEYDTVERYDPETNNWSYVASMSLARTHMGVAVLNGQLYVCGGKTSSQYLRSTESYDPRTNQWTDRANLNQARFSHTVVKARGFLYAIGGSCNIRFPLTTVDRYDPITDTWKKIYRFENVRAVPRCAIFNNRLLAYHITGMVEEYDLVNNMMVNPNRLQRYGESNERKQLISIPKQNNLSIGDCWN